MGQRAAAGVVTDGCPNASTNKLKSIRALQSLRVSIVSNQVFTPTWDWFGKSLGIHGQRQLLAAVGKTRIRPVVAMRLF